MFTEEMWKRINKCETYDELNRTVAELKTELDEVRDEVAFYKDWETDIRKQ